MGEGAGPAALSFPGRDGGGTTAVTVPAGARAARAWLVWFCAVSDSGTARLRAWGSPRGEESGGGTPTIQWDVLKGL